MRSLLQLVPLLVLVAPISADSCAKENTELPFNEYNALKLLAKWKVSTIELPVYIDQELKDIYGADNNQNQVRDDYEKMLLSTYQRPEYVVMGLLAAKEWDRLLDIYNNTVKIEDTNQAKALIGGNNAIRECYFQLQKIDNTLISPVQAFFNSDERLNAKKQAEGNLLSMLEKQHKTPTFHNKPCSVFTHLLKTALPPESYQDPVHGYSLNTEHTELH